MLSVTERFYEITSKALPSLLFIVLLAEVVSREFRDLSTKTRGVLKVFDKPRGPKQTYGTHIYWTLLGQACIIRLCLHLRLRDSGLPEFNAIF